MKIFEPGSGILLNDYKFKPGVLSRIEALGKLNDRRLEYISRRDFDGLHKLAIEYSALNMPRTASAIFKEIAVMKQKRHR